MTKHMLFFAATLAGISSPYYLFTNLLAAHAVNPKGKAEFFPNRVTERSTSETSLRTLGITTKSVNAVSFLFLVI